MGLGRWNCKTRLRTSVFLETDLRTYWWTFRPRRDDLRSIPTLKVRSKTSPVLSHKSESVVTESTLSTG